MRPIFASTLTVVLLSVLLSPAEQKSKRFIGGGGFGGGFGGIGIPVAHYHHSYYPRPYYPRPYYPPPPPPPPYYGGYGRPKVIGGGVAGFAVGGVVGGAGGFGR
ncbi:unnamed protein product [Acanthoscelides obtectus]|uniref:Uncharacterized protein n=1 Tax=Acanthoscelides obtectus TaxID=200917 RepID=A0A9P0PXI4_ACAOB|nr:unnamed protein product [Acanthoscelides obtectus]CAK1675402.1 hypothetical protein AOBTE_LOCUS30203 [Acanthoscelides obtectus]